MDDDDLSFSADEYDDTIVSGSDKDMSESDLESSDSDEFLSESDDSSSDSDEFENSTEDDEEDTVYNEIIDDDEKYFGFPFLNKFEKARVLGVRAEQINAGSKIFVKTNETDPIKIAEEELKQRRMPIIIRRYLGKLHFDISVNSLKQL